MTTHPRPATQCQKPTGAFGRFTLWRMNKSHSKLTDWGLSHISIKPNFTILDVGCGGGRTIFKLAARAANGKVCGIDYSAASVAFSQKLNALSIAAGRVHIEQASVSQLSFPDNTFDIVTAVETHFWWPDLPTDLCEVFRVTKPGGRLAIIAEVHKGATNTTSRLLEKYARQTGLRMLTPEEHHQLLASAGFSNIEIDAQPATGWITALGAKP